jgi:hypothetical protein
MMSPQFTDEKSTTWTMRITGKTVRRVADVMKLDIGNLSEPQEGYDVSLMEMFATKLPLRLQLVYLICEDQAIEAGIDEDHFYDDVLGIDHVQPATEALVEAWTYFFKALGQTEDQVLLAKYLEARTAQSASRAKHFRQINVTELAADAEMELKLQEADRQSQRQKLQRKFADCTRTAPGSNSVTSPELQEPIQNDGLMEN